MKYLKLGYLMFIKNFRLNFVVIFQLVAMVLVGINLISLLSIGVKTTKTLSPLTEKKFVYYMSVENFLNMMDINEENHDLSEMKKNEISAEELNLRNVKFKTRVFQTDAAFYNDDALEYTEIYAYNKQMIDNLKLPLKTGSWFNSETKSNDIIDAVSNLNDVFNVGDIINLTVKTRERKKVDFKVRIIGILKNPAYIPTASVVGQEIFSAHLFNDTSYNKTGAPAILINSDDIEKIEQIFTNTPKNEFIVFNDNIGEEEYDSNIKAMTSKGLVATSEDISNTDKEWISTSLEENLPMIIFLAILSLIGLISISIINMTNYLKTFSIYFICGCTWKNCYKVIVSYFSIIFLWTFSLTLLLALIFTKINTPIFSLIDINPLSCIWFIGVISVYLIISLAAPASVLKKSTLKETLNKIQ